MFNFHFQRVDEQIQAGKSWDSPLSMGSIVNLAGTEVSQFIIEQSRVFSSGTHIINIIHISCSL